MIYHLIFLLILVDLGKICIFAPEKNMKIRTDVPMGYNWQVKNESII